MTAAFGSSATYTISETETLENSYQTARKTRDVILGILEKLERAPTSAELVTQLQNTLTSFEATCTKCDMLVKSGASVRTETKAGVANLVAELQQYRAAALRHQLQLKDAASRSEWDDAVRRRRQAEGGRESLIQIDTMYQEQTALQNARARAQEIEEMGNTALTSLVEQRKMLEAAAEKMLRIADTIGISDQLMKVIKRRDTVDKLIIWGGMGAIVLLMLVLWYFVRR